MAPLRSSPSLSSARRRSSLSFLSMRRRSFAPKNYTFAPNLTPISYPSDPASPSSTPSPTPDDVHVDTDIKETDELAALATATAPASSPSRPRRRGGRKASVDHIPRPPNAFMLFRQNFVHQRHVPGSIETNHNSLSKIVGNCWKALPSKEKKIWETLAEKKKEEHKQQYPHYRFQPKHDPEKKRKRQAARITAEKAERERLMREQGQFADSSESIPEAIDENELDLRHSQADQEKERAMATRRQQVRAMHNHLGHRRSSSVPLPSETYPGYAYGSNAGGTMGLGAPFADPFNFANPALAQTPASQHNASPSNGIAIPTLPSNISGVAGSSYLSNAAGNSDETGGTGQFSFPPHLHAPQPRPITLSRTGSPRLPMDMAGVNSFGSGFGEFSGMSSMNIGVNMNFMGMGPRASRQYQLGQLGRRASSTQPILQHQLASGAFGNFQYGAVNGFMRQFGQQSTQGYAQGSSGPFDFNANQHQQGGFDGFVGAVAEGFTNPFASSTQSVNVPEGGATTSSDLTSTSGSYSAPLAPNAMWYEVDAVDPMTPVQQVQCQTSISHASRAGQDLAPVDTGLLNPSFNFNAASDNISSTSGPGSGSRLDAPPSPKSASASAPHSAMQAHFGPMSAPVHSSNSAPGTGMRDSFDFSAFNSFLSQFPGQNQNFGQSHAQTQNHHEALTASSSSDATGVTLVQPIPLRKVGLPSVPERHAAMPVYHEQTYAEHNPYQEQYVSEQAHAYQHEQTSAFQEHAQYPSSQQSSNASSGSSVNASPASSFAPITSQQQAQHFQHQLEADIVSGHELLDGPVDVNAASSGHTSNIQQHVQSQGACASGVDPIDFGYDLNGLGSLGAQNMYQMGMAPGVDMGAGYGHYAHATQTTHTAENGSNDQNNGPRFSLSDFVHGSPFASSASAVAN